MKNKIVCNNYYLRRYGRISCVFGVNIALLMLSIKLISLPTVKALSNALPYPESNLLNLTWRFARYKHKIQYQTSNPELVLAWSSNQLDNATSVAWGDWDNDGDLDLAVGNGLVPGQCEQNRVYQNDDGTLNLAWSSLEIDCTQSVAWGDWDNDGDLDLAVGNGTAFSEEQNRVYENMGGNLILAWSSPTSNHTQSIAWGDWNNDGYLDLAVGNNGQSNQVYENNDGNLALVWSSAENDNTNSIAWGDFNNDNYLDLAVGNYAQPNRVYSNIDGNLILAWSSAESDNTSSIAWGDFNNDNYLDLAVGNYAQPNRVYQNYAGTLSLAWTSYFDSDSTSSIAWGDWDNDYDMDLAVGNNGMFDKVYTNNAGVLSLIPYSLMHTGSTSDIAWGDWDLDGDLDLAAGRWSAPISNYQADQVYTNNGSHISLDWTLFETNNPRSIAWGDWDGDHDLDLAVSGVGANYVYANNNGILSLVWTFPTIEQTYSLAWGDWDGDNDLDLAVGSLGANQVYTNSGGSLTLAWTASEVNDDTWSVAWGDWDGDSDLDLAVGNRLSPNRVYRNDGGSLSLVWSSPISEYTSSVAWGDWDGDSDLDLAVGNWGAAVGRTSENRVYANNNGDLSLAWSSEENDDTWSIAWGDWDSDGDLDLAAGNRFQPNRVYENNNGNGLTLAWSSPELDETRSIGWGDWDLDGDLDLVTGSSNQSILRIYSNVGGDLHLAPFSPEVHGIISTAWGDKDGDGDLDLAVGIGIGIDETRIYENQIIDAPLLPDTATRALIDYPGGDVAYFFSSATVMEGPILPITYTLQDAEGDEARQVMAYYSLNSGSTWLPAIAAIGTITTNLSASPTGTSHIYYWDIYASGIFGTSDTVVFRLDVYQGFDGPGPYMYPYLTAKTLPFRLRGSQVRVVDDSIPTPQAQSNALVYRQPIGVTEFEPYQDSTGHPYHTNPAGYLQGHGEINLGDRLIALVPILATQSYTIYHTSAYPTIDGLEAFTVTTGGVQTLTTSVDNTFILFNLVVSLEWDARQDPTFLTQLENDIQRASEILFDISNGQAAIGKVHIYHDKGYWGHANIVIKATNTQRPSAILGGIVITPTNDMITTTTGTTITLENAYVPGQIRMPPTWNRFGDPGGTIGEDWPRTLAHELGHYLFFHPDNYLGLTPEGFLTIINCPGSIMTDPYVYSEFLTPDEWNGVCLDSLAERYLGRSDWETIHTFYPMLAYTGTNSGPSTLPLAVTDMEFFAPLTLTTTLADPFFRLVDASGNPSPISQGQAEAYLIKTQDNNDPTDDYVIFQGAPVGDLVQVRGVAPGDRLCLFDYSQTPLRSGCLNDVGNVPTPVMLHELPGWEPQIRVGPVSTTTVIITVTNVSETQLYAQLLPAIGMASEEVPMLLAGDQFTQTLTAPEGAYYGHVRIWVPGSSPPREMMVEYVALEDWGGHAYAWGGHAYAWGNPAYGWGGHAYAWGGHAYAWGGHAYAWGAPVMSSDGQVSLFPLSDLFSGNRGYYTLQMMNLPPGLPSWLTRVGHAYRFEAEGEIPESGLIFRYLARDVPDGYENNLRVYYSPDEGLTWQRLSTELDTYRNHASTQVQGEGIYVLVATIEMPPLTTGWNLFAYPVQETRAVTEALASIDDYYTSVYYQLPSTQAWQLHDQTVLHDHPKFAGLVNDLDTLLFAHSYWLYATEPITPYIGVPGGDGLVSPNTALPPATFYGWITPTQGFTPTVGMSVTATINGQLCGQGVVTDAVEATRLAYKIQIVANTGNGCSVAGSIMTFAVGGQVMDHDHSWDNNQAQYRSLTTPAIPIADLTLDHDGPTELGIPTTFTATIAAGTSPVYEWSFGDGTTAIGEIISHTYTAPGRYWVAVTAYNNVSNMSETALVAVDIPIAGLVATNNSPTPLEQGTTLTATITAGTNVSYLWLFGNGSIGDEATTVHMYPTVGTYTAVVIASNSLGFTLTTTTVEIEEAITDLAITSNSPTLWGSPTLLATTLGSGTNVSYTWNLGDGASGSGANLTHTYTETGVYTVIVTASNQVSVMTATTTAIVEEAVTGLIAVNDSPTTLGNLTTLTATIGTGTDVSYLWHLGDGITRTGSIITYKYPAAGIYTATIIAYNHVSSITVPTVVIVQESIRELSASNNSPTASGFTTFLTATIGSGTDVSYLWDFGDNSNGTGSHPTHNYLTAGTYTAIITASNQVSVMTTTTTIVVQDKVVDLVVLNNSPTTLNQATTFTVTMEAGTSVTYTWNFGDGSPFVTGEDVVVTHTYTMVDIYTATLTAHNLVSHITATATIIVQPYQLYLPVIVTLGSPAAPDLVVETIQIEASGIQVVIANRGQAPVSAATPFWVDLYVGPRSIPTVNDIWPNIADEGVVWGINASALPLMPGETLTLTLNDDYYWPSLSVYSGPPAAGTAVFVQVDSAYSNTTYGAVLENHEIQDGNYNNISVVVYQPTYQ